MQRDTETQRRVLLLDHSDSDRQAFVRTLRDRALTVDEVRTTAEAAARLKSHTYAVVLLDEPIGEDGGIDGADLLRGGGALAPVVLLLLHPGQRLEPIDPRHAHGVVRKPFNEEEIADVVAACAEVRSRRALEMMAAALLSTAPLIGLLDL